VSRTAVVLSIAGIVALGCLLAAAGSQQRTDPALEARLNATLAYMNSPAYLDSMKQVASVKMQWYQDHDVAIFIESHGVALLVPRPNYYSLTDQQRFDLISWASTKASGKHDGWVCVMGESGLPSQCFLDGEPRPEADWPVAPSP